MKALNLEFPTRSKVVAYVDEVGRGCLFGPVVAAAVIMPSEYDVDDKLVMQINDSKKISAKKRKVLEDYIKNKAIAYAIGIATVEEIDKHNILQASFMAMHRALDKVYEKIKFEKIEIDGNSFKPYMPPINESDWIQHECFEGGDGIKMGIAAASILAKVYRDDLMDNMCDQFPRYHKFYDIKKNKGYGTPNHLKGIKQNGACTHHRKSFAPVSRALLASSQIDIEDANSK